MLLTQALFLTNDIVILSDVLLSLGVMEILALDLQGRSFRASQQFIDEVDLAAESVNQDQLFSPIPARSPNATTCRGQGQHLHALRASSPISMTPDSALL